MPINLEVFRQIRVVPVRFERCVDPDHAWTASGPVRADCPDPDDRGYLVSQLRGPVLPIAFDTATHTGDTAYVKLIREGVEDKADLFVTSVNPKVVAVDSPAEGVTLPHDGRMVIRLQSRGEGATRIQIVFGDAATGPVIGELTVLVTALRAVHVCLHRTEIHGAGTGQTGPDLIPRVGNTSDYSRADALLAAAGKIWRPHGIRFVVLSHVDSSITDVNNGILSKDASGSFPQFDAMMAADRAAHAINIHFIHQIADGHTLGLGRSRVGTPDSYGVGLPDKADLNDLAHEIGHVLDLAPGAPPHADDDDATHLHLRKDYWTVRRLMHSYNPCIPSQPYLLDIGYGVSDDGHTRRGALISVKNLAGDPADGEHDVAVAAGTPPLP